MEKNHHQESRAEIHSLFAGTTTSRHSFLMSKGAIDAFCGSLGGVASILLGHPLDTAKVRMQSSGGGGSARYSTHTLQPLPQYKGTWDCLNRTYRYEGVRGLYKGVLSPLLGASVTSATMFYTYNNVVRRLGTHEFSLWPHMAGGAISGLVNSFLDTPLELVKSKMQVLQTARNIGPTANRSEHYQSTVHCASQIARNFGIRGLFQGLSVTIARNVLGGIIYWSLYEYLKHYLQLAWVYASDYNELKQFSELTRRDSATPIVIVGASAVAGATCCLGNYWLDSVKSCVQVDVSDRSKRRFGTWTQYLRDMVRQRGVLGLYRGCSAALMRSGIGVSCFLVYEWATKHLQKL